MIKNNKIAALFVLEDGPYSELKNIDLWGVTRDARKYNGLFKIIAHPPCERWGRYWNGGPSVKIKRSLGDDDGCFRSALISVRKWGGVIEHPEASYAFHNFYLPIPKRSGGWTEPDIYGGRSCCVAQGHYGHQAQKLTWLYGIDIDFRELKWGLKKGTLRLDQGYHSAEERRKAIRCGAIGRMSARQRKVTPIEFRDLLIQLVKGNNMAKQKLKPFDGLGPKEIKNIRSAIRLVWQRSHARKLVVKRCTAKNGFTYCEKCKLKCPALKVDHIKQVGDLNNGFIGRLFCPSKEMQGLCKACHDLKTSMEKQAAKKDTPGVKKREKKALFME